MGKNIEIQFYKETSLPAQCMPNSVYFILNGLYAEVYVTDANGVPKEGGNTDMINALIASSGGGGANALYYTAENKDSINLPKGTPVAIHSSGTGFVRASAVTGATACIGLLGENIAVNVAGKVQIAGFINLTDWTSITGTTLLTLKSKYYLLDTIGLLATAPPVIPSYISQMVGLSIDAQTIEIKLANPILL